ncbi:hypothetical protein HBI56_080610 [Parastagonospora nodorum]|uniref:Small ribosomal subunit protein mS38 n=1 Tax=Phaeosphaeria nodorum (strain SN15 / ATCC MYA-4574 / FGSC 10173) TaxID=321614 RepID=A0A7U2I8B9_PHANO|nr:hypothetical protein HBH56_106100 [Parastagonospora nodorum]QRD04807.1 hypothetical protein JI435_107340 [Parastagonospora nodorum SN15]KAH3929586.1 hypothetical protein HBH54_124310 [Parastagonospora nodorum]KAH3951807.1 hypothetical protein HBH53_058310 [Parastagonospora nodorum]KAH3975637.1 hypothetical protein HBH52_128560 [Parastagonospora nodorum]
MFAPSFARAARSTTSISTTPASSLCRASLTTASKSLHQRRYSSSKSSIPPSNKKKPVEELEQNAPTQLQDPKTGAESKDEVKKIPFASSADNVPHAPPTTHLHEDDVRLSTFFAMHQPISFHREAWQQSVTSMGAIDDLFNTELNGYRMKAIQKTESTLTEFLQRVSARMDIINHFEEQKASEAMQESDIFGEPQPQTEESIMHYASKLLPFIPPPPPLALDSFAQQSVHAQEVNERITEVDLPVEQTQRPATFREHVHRRRGGMLLISVKRQRKLKMKKHKYKKLMKRTRLERRKLDRT